MSSIFSGQICPHVALVDVAFVVPRVLVLASQRNATPARARAMDGPPFRGKPREAWLKEHIHTQLQEKARSPPAAIQSYTPVFYAIGVI